METPPLDAGAAHDRDTWPLPALAVRPVGAPGGVPAMGEAVMVTFDVAVFAGGPGAFVVTTFTSRSFKVMKDAPPVDFRQRDVPGLPVLPPCDVGATGPQPRAPRTPFTWSGE